MKKYIETKSKIELIGQAYTGLDDLNDEKNHPFHLLAPNPSSNAAISCIELIFLPNYHGNILLTGNTKSNLEIWQAKSRFPQSIHSTKASAQSLPIASILFDVHTNSLVILISSLSSVPFASKSPKSSGYVEIHLFEFDCLNDEFSFNLKFTETLNKSKKLNQFHPNHNKSIKSSNIILSKLLFSPNEVEKMNFLGNKLLVLWEEHFQSDRVELNLDLFHIDKLSSFYSSINPPAPVQDAYLFFTNFAIPPDSQNNSLVHANLLVSSVEAFNYTNTNKTLNRILPNLPPNPDDLNFEDEKILTVSFDFLFATSGEITKHSYISSPRKVLHQLYLSLLTQFDSNTLLYQLNQCKSVHLIDSISENEIMFEIFDVLLRNNMISAICKYVSKVTRLELISEWLLHRFSNLHHFITTELLSVYEKTKEKNRKNHEKSETIRNEKNEVEEIILLLKDFENILACLFLPENWSKFEKNKVILKLEALVASIEWDLQFSQVVAWFLEESKIFLHEKALHDALKKSQEKSKIPFKKSGKNFDDGDADEEAAFIDLLVLESDLPSNFAYPPDSSADLIGKIFGKAPPAPSDLHTTRSFVENKFKVIFYYLQDLERVLTGSGAENDVSSPFSEKLMNFHEFFYSKQQKNQITEAFATRFSGILTKEAENEVRGYWNIDNHDLEEASRHLLVPNTPIHFPIQTLQAFHARFDLVQRFLFQENAFFTKENHKKIIEILLKFNNILLALQFIRKQCVSTINVDFSQQKLLLSILFAFCLEKNKMEALFLFPLSQEEESLLLQFLGEHKKYDLKNLYFLQRSKFMASIYYQSQLPANVKHQLKSKALFDNYLTVLPPVISSYVQQNKYLLEELQSQAAAPSAKFALPSVPSSSSFAKPSSIFAPVTPKVSANTPYKKVNVRETPQLFTPFTRSSKAKGRPNNVESTTPSAIPFVPFK